MSNVKYRWLGKIVTDLSVNLEGKTVDDVRALVLATKDDPWAIKFADIICDDFGKLSYGMGQPSHITVRDLAAHAANRYAYFNARVDSRNPILHRTLDRLLDWTSPMEGALPITIEYKEGNEFIREALGKYGFHAYTMRAEFEDLWHHHGYELIAENRYE